MDARIVINLVQPAAAASVHCTVCLARVGHFVLFVCGFCPGICNMMQLVCIAANESLHLTLNLFVGGKRVGWRGGGSWSAVLS
jgi:hypothetical protein